MKPITKESVELMREKIPKRICFETTHRSQLAKTAGKNYFGRIYVPFGAGFKRIFPFELFPNPRDRYHEDSHWRVIHTETEFDAIGTWIKHQGSRVFLRDCLHASVALSLNRDENTGKRTKIDLHVYRAKQKPGSLATRELAEHCVNAIKDLSPYKPADLVCAVPPQPGKSFDLPSKVAKVVSSRLGKDNITDGFRFGAGKKLLKDIKLGEKWAAWDGARLSFNGADISGKQVILIDDEYQSGTTMQYIAMKLQEAGAYQVCGLSMVKAMSDKDNQ